MLWKAADQHATLAEDIGRFEWEIQVQDDIPIPAVAAGDPAPPQLTDVNANLKEGSAAL